MFLTSVSCLCKVPVHILWTEGSLHDSHYGCNRSLFPAAQSIVSVSTMCMFALIFPPSFFFWVSHLLDHSCTHTHSLYGTGIVQYRFHIHAISGLVTVKFSFKILTPQLTLCLKRRAWYKLTDQNYPIPYYPIQFDNCMCLFLNSHYYYLTWTFLKKTTRNNFRETLIFLTQYNRLLGNN